ncbi:MAG TPA: phage major capsid protein [Rhodanobacteraceae bacterium]
MYRTKEPAEQFAIAQAEAAKTGLSLKVGFGNDASRSEQLQERADLRRLANDLREQATVAIEANDTKRAEQITDALDAVAAIIGKISRNLDLQDAARERIDSRSTDDTDLRDQSGVRIGTLLTNADLSDEGKIAAKLGHRMSNNAFGGDADEGGLAAFFRGVAGGRTTDAIKASLSEGTDSQGGHAVPSWLLPGILKALVPASSMLQAGTNVAVLQQPGDSFKVAAVDSVPTAAWRDENGALSESDPTFRGVTIVPRSLSFIFKVSRELLMDAPGMEQALRVAIAQAFAKEIDRAGLIGTGTAPEIRGVLNTTGINTYAMGTDGAELSNYAPIIKAARTIADDNAPAPTAIITSNREAETIDLFADTTGQPLRRPPALDALKFIATSQVPTDDTQGTATDASTMYLGNWTFATLYMREQLSVLKLDQLYAANGQVGFACHARVDLALAYPSAFCAIKGVIPAA